MSRFNLFFAGGSLIADLTGLHTSFVIEQSETNILDKNISHDAIFQSQCIHYINAFKHIIYVYTLIKKLYGLIKLYFAK